MPKGRQIGPSKMNRIISSGGFGIRWALESQFRGTKCWKWWEIITFWGRNYHCRSYSECLKHVRIYVSIFIYICIYICIPYPCIYQPFLNHVGVSILHSRHHQKWHWWWIAGPSRDGNDKRNRWLFWTGRGPFLWMFILVVRFPWSMHLSNIYPQCSFNVMCRNLSYQLDVVYETCQIGHDAGILCTLHDLYFHHVLFCVLHPHRHHPRIVRPSPAIVRLENHSQYWPSGLLVYLPTLYLSVCLSIYLWFSFCLFV